MMNTTVRLTKESVHLIRRRPFGTAYNYIMIDTGQLNNWVILLDHESDAQWTKRYFEHNHVRVVGTGRVRFKKQQEVPLY